MRLHSQTRPLSTLPSAVVWALLLCLLLQCAWHFKVHQIQIKQTDLPNPPAPVLMRLVSLDDPITAAKLTMLWLQAFDNQPGISLPLTALDYRQVRKWLNLVLELDHKTQYPLLAAIRFYALVQDEAKQRIMVDYVIEQFLAAPNRRWAAMTHAVYIAKHRIGDVALARHCASLLRQYATGDDVPFWAKQMEIFILEDMGELEAAKVLLGGLLASGELDDDPHQRRFLGQRLEQIKARQAGSEVE